MTQAGPRRGCGGSHVDGVARVRTCDRHLEESIARHALASAIESATTEFVGCVDSLPETDRMESRRCTVRYHFLRCDGTGRVKLRVLAKVLAHAVITYAIPPRQRMDVRAPHEYARLFTEARDLFRTAKRSGEPGEVLLYMLLESALAAPQVLSKLDLKTSSEMEVIGGDGVHWCVPDSLESDFWNR